MKQVYFCLSYICISEKYFVSNVKKLWYQTRVICSSIIIFSTFYTIYFSRVHWHDDTYVYILHTLAEPSIQLHVDFTTHIPQLPDSQKDRYLR